MNDGLQDVITAAIENSERKAASEVSGRWMPQLRAVDSKREDARAVEPPAPPPAALAPEGSSRLTRDASSPAPAPAKPAINDADLIGRSGLRLAFWLCGFHEAFTERQRRGEQLTDHEESLLALSRKEFVGIRSVVIQMALERLHAVVHAPDLVPEAEAGAARAKPMGTMEAFALDTLRGLSRRALQLMQDSGPDAAFSLFSEDTDVQEPLAIFQVIFTTALGLVESFERLSTADSKLLARVAAALGTEVEGI